MDNKPKEPVLSRVELNKEKHSKKKPIRIIIAVVLVLVLGLGAYEDLSILKLRMLLIKPMILRMP